MTTRTAAATRRPSKVADVLTLAKVRLNALVVATSAGGYYLGAPGPIDPAAMALTCVGTGLVAGGAAALNQVQERDLDRLMTRTRARPVAADRMSLGEGATIAGALTAVGAAMLWYGANGLAALVALVTLVSYVGVYTPLKRRTPLSTIVGAVPGALPPLVGWAAAHGSIASVAPWSLFLVMFFWQLPHFLAIAWLYREDYARAGLPMLAVVDPRGAMTGRQAVLWAAMLVPLSQVPYLVGLTTTVHAVGAMALGVGQLMLALRFALRRTDDAARTLFYGTITYLPLLWLLMAAAKR
jgi:protoheme IX farnesyltransferase